MRCLLFLLILVLAAIGCAHQDSDKLPKREVLSTTATNEAFVQILGIAQDAGYPQLGCTKSCCKDLWDDPVKRKMVSCIALIDPAQQDYWLFDATPDIKDQIALSNASLNQSKQEMPAGIFLTHAHIGHYTGLMQLGREAFGSKNVPVYSMPRMVDYLTNNGPWSQLVALNNIQLNAIANEEVIKLPNGYEVLPISVPHRDEFSETVGYKIIGPSKKVLFIPDIDKWNKWDKNIIDEIGAVDIALLDGSFYANGEIPGRDMSLIPHPFIEESMALFENLPDEEKSKIYFIHLNHTNPVLDMDSDAYQTVVQKGFHIAAEGQTIVL